MNLEFLLETNRREGCTAVYQASILGGRFFIYGYSIKELPFMYFFFLFFFTSVRFWQV